jgi:hypothetical protein
LLSEGFNHNRGFGKCVGPESWPTKTKPFAKIKDRIRPQVLQYPGLYEKISQVYDKWMASGFSLDEDPRTYRTAKEVNDVVFDWLATTEGDFFLWVHYMDVRKPYIYREEYFKQVAGYTLPKQEFRTVCTTSKVINREQKPTERN